MTGPQAMRWLRKVRSAPKGERLIDSFDLDVSCSSVPTTNNDDLVFRVMIFPMKVHKPTGKPTMTIVDTPVSTGWRATADDALVAAVLLVQERYPNHAPDLEGNPR